MKMMKHIALALTMALSAFVLPQAASAAHNGDIRGIHAVPDSLQGVSFPNGSSPLTAGQQFYVLVRLVNPGYPDFTSSAKPWYFKSSALGVLNPTLAVLPEYLPQLGLSVGGQRRYARYSATGPNGELSGANTQYPVQYTDLYFVYTVQAGDLGLPVKILGVGGGVADGESVIQMLNVNTATAYWDLVNDAEPTRTANLWLTPEIIGDLPYYPSFPHDRPHRSLDFAAEGVYVKAVDFDDNMDDASDGVWRNVYPGMTDAVNNVPRLVCRGAGESTTVYVWSSDESVFEPVGDGLTTVNGRKVLPVTIMAGETADSQTYASFKLKGNPSATPGATAAIILSATTETGYTAVGDEIACSTISNIVRVVEAPPPTVSLRFNGDESRLSLTCKTNYTDHAAQLTVMIAPTCAEDVWVDIEAHLENTGDLSQIFAETIIGLSSVDGGNSYQGTTSKVKIPAGQSSVQLYLYTLGYTKDTYSSKDGILFTPAIAAESAATGAQINQASGCVLWINRFVPVLDAPTELTVTSGVETELPVTVVDTYQNLQNAEPDGSGDYVFTIEIDGEKFVSGTDFDFTYEEGVFVLAPTFELEGGTEYTATISVKAPSGVSSTKKTMILTVGKPKQIVASLGLAKPYKIAEGGTTSVALSLEGGTRSKEGYAFLVPKNGAGAYVNTNVPPFSSGVLIQKNSKEAVDTPEIQFLDGTQTLEFDVVFSTTQDKVTPVAGFAQGAVYVTVTNILPVVTSSAVNGYPVSNGLAQAVPKGVASKLSVTVNDVQADKQAEGDGAFQVKWVIFDGAAHTYTTYGNPDALHVAHTFLNDTTGGEGALVQVFLKDKDSIDFPLTPDYFFRVPVNDSPRVVVALANEADNGVWDETMSNEREVTVTLTAAATTALVVRVTAPDAIGTNAGYLRFKYRTGFIEPVDGHPDQYDLHFRAGQTSMNLTVSDMDGTAATLAGIDISASVITETDSGFGKTWKDYYEPSLPLTVKIRNVAPEMTVPSEDDAATTNGNAKAFAPFTVPFRVGSDVKNDMKNGIIATLTVDGTELETRTVYDTLPYVFTTPVQFTASGIHRITVTFSDKDGSPVLRRTLVYNVLPTKSIVVAAHGPASASAAPNGHSHRYELAAGLGAGRIDALSHQPQNIQSWVSTYSVAVTESAFNVIAKGYTLANAVNTMIDSKGTYVQGGAGNFDYTRHAIQGSQGFDSYFYAWACNNTKESDGIESETTIMIGPSREARIAIPLQPYDDKVKAYDTQYWEAVFSRELYAEDNAGDINQDGIPDVYVARYGFGILDPATTALMGNDLASIDAYNEDGDLLPVIDSGRYAPFIPGTAESWDLTGAPFDAVTEIRGFHHGLNDAPVKWDGLGRVMTPTVSTNSFSALELDAARIAGALNADGVPVIEKWSPERPTDPTKADTDNDGMPDGYEYYIWYRATVGYMDNGVHKFLTGRRYVPAKPGEPALISSSAIAALYDPRAKHPDHTRQTTDTDNDGLPDYLEFELGTNPFDFDTDGDGLPDGYEVMVSQTDPLDTKTGSVADASSNPDKDAMAAYSVDMSVVAVADGDGSVAWYCAPAGTPFETVVGETAYTGAVFSVTGGDGKAERYMTVQDLAGLLSAKTDNGGILAGDLSKEKTWRLVDAGDGKWTRGLPADVMRGTVVSDVIGETNCFAVVFSTNALPETVYKAWKYGVTGGFARGAECPRSTLQKDVADRVVLSVNKQKVEFIHWQVYQEKGFDPRTAWRKDSPAYLSRGYTTLDEFLSMTFYVYESTLAAGELEPTMSKPLSEIWQRYATDPLSADTDGDEIPDGWELYAMTGPKQYSGNGDRLISYYGPDSILSPLKNSESGSDTVGAALTLYGRQSVAASTPLLSVDKDGLDWKQEYSGTVSSAYYGFAPVFPAWRNKQAPTDPWNEDTDDDGLTDGKEKDFFLYAGSGLAGGGLNPLAIDTDNDGLPDPWEAEFAGTLAETKEEPAAADGTNTVTEAAVAVKWNDDGMNGTVADAYLDYDRDGLSNWQEYMVGTMRCWRYDDSVSSWTSLSLDPDEADRDWDNYWYERLVNTTGTNYNPHLVHGMFDQGIYFSRNKNAWEVSGPSGAYGNSGSNGKYYYYKDGVDHELKYPGDRHGGYNRFTEIAADKNAWLAAPYKLMLPSSVDGSSQVRPLTYISCDPRLADTDYDGMDDYFELFHGMNPLLGITGSSAAAGFGKPPRDVIYQAYGGFDVGLTAENNWWLNAMAIHREATRLKPDGLSTDDFVSFPWLAGRADADPDGDNIRNQQEAIMPNLQAPTTWQHLDPSPLWMTDMSYPDSLTRLYYRVSDKRALTLPEGKDGFTGPDGTEYKFVDFDGFSLENGLVTFKYPGVNSHFKTLDVMFSFEENEGYDSDHDFLSDFEEGQGRTKTASDPQGADAPMRRQAMWFNGLDAFLQTPLPVAEIPARQAAAAEPRMNFLYYTVECWAKPDDETVARSGLQTLVERAVVSGSANAADEKYLRKNFVLGLRNGRWYTRFDTAGTDAGQFVEVANGAVATSRWTHVAATYDGQRLCLYVDGVCNAYTATALQPEHGVAAVAVNGNGSLGKDTLTYRMISLLVGASAKTENGVVFDSAYRGMLPTTLEDYDSFFKGYIDEVRIWDGARAASEIASNVTARTRFTAETAKQNQTAVYQAWVDGATRAPDSSVRLPPQLMYHWTFDHLPGAILPTDVVQTPAGFSTAGDVTDARAIWSRPEGWTNVWWSSVGVRSTVYADTSWVPWISDTVAHLPRFDRTTLDSVYWSEDYMGDTPVGELGREKNFFPRTHEVYSRWTQQSYAEDNAEHGWTQTTRWETLAAAASNVVGRLQSLYRFTLRDRNTEGFDLLPMGGAYPRRLSSAEGGMWDDATASDAWAQTGIDSDNNGLPDWWEEYMRNKADSGIDPFEPFLRDTIVTYAGVTMPAWEAYLRDMATGTVKIGDTIKVGAEEYYDRRDTDKDGLPDWWEELFGFDTVTTNDSNADPDGDGLSNYQEYLISEVYARLGSVSGKVGQFPLLNPTQAQSTSCQIVPDYFLRYGSLYLGEMFADHDRIEDAWEDTQSEISIGGTRIANVSRFVYDTDNDPGEMGLSNWSLALAAQDKRNFERLSLGVTTNQTEQVLELYEDEVDKKFEEMCTQYGTNAVKKAKGEQLAIWDPIRGWKQRYIFTITEVEELFEERFIRPVVEINAAVTYNGMQAFGEGSLIVVKAWNEARGMMRAPDAVWTIPVDGTRLMDYQPIKLLEPQKGVLREGKTTFVVYCGGAAGSKDDSAGKGGEEETEVPPFAPGQPYGVVSGVSVGFLTGESFSVELTDVSPTMMRIDLVKALALQRAYVEAFILPMTPADWEQVFSLEESDGRKAYYAALNAYQDSLSSCIDRAAFPEKAASLARLDYAGTNFLQTSSNTLPIRVVQGRINDATAGLDGTGTYYRVLLDTRVPLKERTTFTEGDLLKNDRLDLGWDTLVPAYLAGGAAHPAALTNATFSLVFGEPVYRNDVQVHENVIAVATMNHYEYGLEQTPVQNKKLLTHAGQPTFSWTHTNSIDKVYPAFRLRVWADAAKTVLVYDSGARLAPRRDAEGRYSWTAPLWTGMMTPAGVEFKANTPYWWSVSMLDAKFTVPAESEAADAFMLQATTPGGGVDDYAVIRVGVKYMGPGRFSTSEAKGVIRVEAFASPDFTGQPLGVGYVTNSTALATADTIVCNAVVSGLECDGRTYYVRAFVDSDGDGVRSAWESWGYACYAGVTPVVKKELGVTTFQPKAFAPSNVELVGGQMPECVVYIDDSDTNNNMLPDVWEWDMDGVLGGPSAELTGSLSPYIVERESAVEKTTGIFRDLAEKNASPLLYSTMMLRAAASNAAAKSPAAALVLGGISVADIKTIPEVSISSFSLTDGVISLDLAANGTLAGQQAAQVPATIGVRLTLTLQYATALDAEWQDAGTGTAVVTLGAAPVTVTSDVLTTTAGRTMTRVLRETMAANPSSCYFRVKVAVDAK